MDDAPLWRLKPRKQVKCDRISPVAEAFGEVLRMRLFWSNVRFEGIEPCPCCQQKEHGR